MLACDYIMQDTEGRPSAIGLFDRIELGAPNMWLPLCGVSPDSELGR